jgi:tetratricopeptide (TPR) repeat protein
MAAAPAQGGLSAEQEAELAVLETAAKANPNDWIAQNAWAHALLRANKLMEAWKISEAVVAQDAANPEARTHQGIVLLAIGETDMAVGVLDKVLESSPQFIEALTYRGLLHLRNGDKALAIALWRQAIAADPSQKDLLEPLIAMAEKAAIPPASGGGATSGAPMSGGTASAGSAAADGPGLEGEVQISAELAATVPAGTILFVLARPAGVDRGPPSAVKRIPIESFPVKFKLGPGDSPMGGGLGGDLVITARIDRDGNPTTHSPDDLEGKSAVVQPGASGLVIQLQKPAQ